MFAPRSVELSGGFVIGAPADEAFELFSPLGERSWVVSALDRQQHEVEYHRVEAGRYVARVSVRCRARGDRQTEVRVTYTFIALSESGNRDIAGPESRDV
jgi:hypothetical protein